MHTGGRCYGYDNVKDPTITGADGTPAVRLQINETEAAVVRRIFEMAAEGGSLKAITKTLNREHVPTPRKRKDRPNATWCHTAIREMLRRDLYAGLVIWNRSHFVKRPGTNKRVRRACDPSEWKRLERPDLRIIDEDLWDRVQQHIASMNDKYNFGNRPGLTPRSSTSPHILTGFMKCALCGVNLIIVCGRGKDGHHRYGCPQHYNRGACPNGLRQRADQLEQILFQQLQDAVLRPEAVNYAIQEFERQLQLSLAGLDSRIGRMRQRADDIKQEIETLVVNLIACRHNPTLVEAINTRQKELDEITRQLLSAEPNSVSAEIGRIRKFVAGQLGDIRQLLNGDVRKAKAELEKHVTAIRMVPQGEGKTGFYVAEGEWDLLGGYGEKTGSPAKTDFRMVAGEGFEPSTFGL